MSNAPQLTKDEKEHILQVNSLLMAVHIWDSNAVDDILDAAGDDSGHVMMGAIIFLKETLDSVIEAVKQCDLLEMPFDFADLVKFSANTVINAEESC